MLLNAEETAPERCPLVIEKQSATSIATNANIAPYSLMPCPRAVLRRFRLGSKNIPSKLPPEKQGNN
jgi:hypothetical protein